MNEESRSTRRCECGGNLRADMAALADAGNNNPPGYAANDLDCTGKWLAQTIGKGFCQSDESGFFRFDCARRGSDRIIFDKFDSAFDHGRRLAFFLRRVYPLLEGYDQRSLH